MDTDHAWPTHVTTVAFAGDWHGDTAYAQTVIRSLPATVDALIHTGDFAYTFTDDFLASVSDAATDSRVIVAFVDGNHDNHDWLAHHGAARMPSPRQIAPRIFHVPRGCRWTWDGVTFLGLGGAVSIDRPARIPGLSWWPQEAITARDAQTAKSGGLVDVLVSHDTPAGYLIPGLPVLPPMFEPQALHAAEHRDRLRDVCDTVQPRFIWHGHYHSRYTRTVQFGAWMAQVTGLHCNGRPVPENVDVVDLAVLRSPTSR